MHHVLVVGAGQMPARVEPVDDLVPADLMIEAVVEDAATKEEILRRADAALPGHVAAGRLGRKSGAGFFDYR